MLGIGLLEEAFMQHAFLAGVPIAALAGLVGWFLVLRGQVFGAEALGHVAFTAAVTALAIGVDVRLGLFVGTVGVAVALGLFGAIGAARRADAVLIGTGFAWVLGLGVLALSVYTTTRSATDGNAGVSVLFGSIFGLDAAAARTTALVAAGLVVALLAIARPLLFASLAPDVATTRGVPVRLLGVGFLALVGATAAQATQAVGALLLIGLLAAPAGAAHRLTTRPWLALALSSVLAVFAMVAGLTISHLVPDVPPSFAIIAVAAACYAATFVGRSRRVRRNADAATHSDGG